MYSPLLLVALSGFTLVCAQTPTPSPRPRTIGDLGPAEEVEGNPFGVTYQAILPESEKSTIRGSIAGTSSPDGKGVEFTVNISGLPDSSLGLFTYHVHDQPVPADGNCTGTKAHLDPYIRGQVNPCDPEEPATCEVGDLSGKHGNITSNPFETTYLDLYLSTESGPASFFGNRSIVIHASNSTRLTCANFTLVTGTPGNGTVNDNATTSPNGTVGGSTPVP